MRMTDQNMKNEAKEAVEKAEQVIDSQDAKEQDEAVEIDPKTGKKKKEKRRRPWDRKY